MDMQILYKVGCFRLIVGDEKIQVGDWFQICPKKKEGRVKRTEKVATVGRVVRWSLKQRGQVADAVGCGRCGTAAETIDVRWMYRNEPTEKEKKQELTQKLKHRDGLR